MPDKASAPKFFSIADVTTFIVKAWLPAIFLAGAILICLPPAKPAGVALGALLGIFTVAAFWSIVVVTPRQECLLYRRFLRWKRLEYRDIVKCGRALLLPGLYYLKLRHYEPPLGKLYYVPYTPGSGPMNRMKLSRELMTHIRTRISQEAAGHSPKSD